MDVKTKYVLVVLGSALTVAVESIAIEGALNIENLDLFLVSAIPPIVAGLMLIGVSLSGAISFSRGLGRKGWLKMTVLCLLVAAGVILWFDAVGRIGASKEAILGGGSSEVLFVVLFSAVFLSERLSRLEAIGGVMIVVGVFVVLINTNDMSMSVGVGEIEAILSSLSLGASVVVTTALLKEHELTPLSAVELMYSGILVLLFGVASGMIDWPDAGGWLLLVLLGTFPAVGLLTYNAGLPKIGASLVSVLFALVGIITVCIEALAILFFPEADFMLPENVLLAVVGGLVAFVGVYVLNMKPWNFTRREKSAEGEI